MSLFTVIIPCYNCAVTLPRTIESLTDQTITDWEAICIDDGSQDDTPSLLKRLAAEDPRIRFMRQANAGPSRARNRAAAMARGRILAFLDADDLWLPDKLASVAHVFSEAGDAAASYGRIAFFRNDGEPDATLSTVTPGLVKLADCLGENPMCTLSNLSVTREAFLASGGFDETMRHGEDLEWLVRSVAGGLKVIATDNLNVRYRACEGGLSADLLAMHTGWRRAVSMAGGKVSKGTLRRAEARHLRYLARRALRIGQPPHIALSLALRGLRAAPLAFLGGRHRGPATLIGCLLAPFLPAFIRRRAFA